MTMQTNLISKLTAALAPEHLDVINESHNHNVPPGAESHFKVIAVTALFEGKSLVQRHRLIYSVLNTEMAEKRIHALALHTLTPAEWAKEQADRSSPPCLGGSKR